MFDKTMDLIENEYPDLASDISVMRLGPIDQELNVLMSNAKICLQLSTREGFEVKVSEALHKGVPVIVTRAGGIPLQVEDGKSGFWLTLAIMKRWLSICISCLLIGICTLR